MEKDELIKDLTKKYEKLEYRIENRWEINQRNNVIRSLIKSAQINLRILPFLVSTVLVANTPLVKNNPEFFPTTFIESTKSTEEPIIPSGTIFNTPSTEENKTESIIPSGAIFNTSPEINKIISKKEITKLWIFIDWLIMGLSLFYINEKKIIPITNKKLFDCRHIGINEYKEMKRALEIQRENLEMLTGQDFSRSLKKKTGEL